MKFLKLCFSLLNIHPIVLIIPPCMEKTLVHNVPCSCAHVSLTEILFLWGSLKQSYILS
jgi:hypothetical protein